MLISNYNYLNNEVKYKYFWIISIYLICLFIFVLSFNFKIKIYKKYLSVKKDDIYYLYLDINEYKQVNNKKIYINNNEIKDYKFDLGNYYSTGYVVLSFDYKGKDIEEVNIMVVNDYIYKVIINLMKGEYERT